MWIFRNPLKKFLRRIGLKKPAKYIEEFPPTVENKLMYSFAESPDPNEVNELLAQFEDETHLAFKYLPVCSHLIEIC